MHQQCQALSKKPTQSGQMSWDWQHPRSRQAPVLQVTADSCRPGSGSRQNQGIDKAEGCLQACSHRGAEPTQQRGIQARPCRTHLRGMRRNCRFSSCSCRTRWASWAVSRPVRLWADTIWMFRRSAGREKQSSKASCPHPCLSPALPAPAAPPRPC